MGKKIISLVLALVMCTSIAGMLTACGGGSEKSKIYFYNWGDYIGEDIIELFEEENPEYEVVYDTFATNEEMYQKIVSSGIEYDLLIPSDYMISRMIKEDLLMEIDTSKLENYKYIDEALTHLEYDPDAKYSVPYTWGVMGIVYNPKLVKEPVDSWSILWDKKYDQQILMLDSVRDTMGCVLKSLGYSMNTGDAKEIAEARDKLIEGKPLWADWGVDTVKEPIVNESYAMLLTWSGDAMEIMAENEDIEFAVPKEGSNIFFDSMVIPKNSRNPEGAMKLIDFLCRTDVAAMNAEYIGYSTPQTEALKELGDEYINDPTYNPSKEVIDRCEVFYDIGDSMDLWNEAWERVIQASVD